MNPPHPPMQFYATSLDISAILLMIVVFVALGVCGYLCWKYKKTAKKPMIHKELLAAMEVLPKNDITSWNHHLKKLFAHYLGSEVMSFTAQERLQWIQKMIEKQGMSKGFLLEFHEHLLKGEEYVFASKHSQVDELDYYDLSLKLAYKLVERFESMDELQRL